MDITLSIFLNNLLNIFALYIAQTTLLDKPFTKRNHIIYIVSISIVSLLPLLPPVDNAICIVSAFIFLALLTNKHLINTIIALFGYLFTIFYNYILLHLYTSLSGLSANDIVYSTVHTTVFNLIFFITLYIILKLIKKTILPFTIFSSRLKKSFILSILIFLGICSLIFILYFSYEQKMDFPQELTEYNQILFWFLFIFIVIIMSQIIITIYNDSKTQDSLKEMEYLKNYTSEIENLYNSTKSFKHDYTNILYSLKSYIDEKNIDGLKSYYYDNILPIATSLEGTNPAIESLTNIKIPELKSILYIKILEADKAGIKVNLEAKWPIVNINLKTIDLTRIVGIFLDNAIEAASVVNELDRYINIAFIRSDKDIVFIISNPMLKSELPISSLNKMGVSSKGSGRGTGLYNVQIILSNYENALLTTQVDAKTFTQTLEIS